MAVTKEDLRDFARYADEKLQNGAGTTMTDLVKEWESQRGNENAIQVDVETIRKLATFFPEVQDDAQSKREADRCGGVTTAEMLGRAMLAAARAGRK